METLAGKLEFTLMTMALDVTGVEAGHGISGVMMHVILSRLLGVQIKVVPPEP